MANLGFIGLGAMGSRIAERLRRDGHSMTVCDRNAKRREALTAKGAAAARTPAEVAARSEILAEALALGEKAGIERERLAEVFNLILAYAAALEVPVPAAAVAAQLCAAQAARGPDEDFSATIRLMRQLAGTPA
jgi:3-hydroxyisobutyrate dehydrogenase-like beta-hydroxyacid dehydrogenase